MSLELEIELPDFDEDIETHKGVKRYVQILADAWFKTPTRIACTVVGVICCLAIIGWNLSRLGVLDQLIAAEVEEFQLEDELSSMRIEISALDSETMHNAIQTENEKVFQGFPELAAWAESLSEIAANRGIELTYRVEDVHLAAIEGLLEVPVTLEFKAFDGSADNLFVSAMNLVGVILQDHWHIDVDSTSASGSGEKLEVISVGAQVWVKDRFGFVNEQLLADAMQSEEEFDLDEPEYTGDE